MAAWLDLVPDVKGWSLIDTGRLQEILQDMSHPESQFPSFIYFAGNGHRMKALRALFTQNNVTRKGPAGLVRLHVSPATVRTESPIIFAESNLGNRTGLGATSVCGQSITNSRRWPIHHALPHEFEDLERAVIRKLLFPWTDIFCTFVDSLSEIENLKMLFQNPREKLVVGGQEVPETMRMIIVLDESPTRNQGFFTCRGSIFCSRPKARDILSCVSTEIPGGKFQTSRGHQLGSLQDDDGCDLCGYYRKKVSFSVASLDEEITLGIANDQIYHKIGGFPKSVYGILQAQQAFAYFGRSDHSEVSWPPKRFCYCCQRTRKRVHFMEPALELKRRRL
ncbi:uncharacterized protein N7458_002542 [Penicillium daleae]|uniref:Uncharacterized protein n=1 Tax=Penicillium daleae TaxID=63821 RepID=A0AAD6G6V6_9EURO|nr:uncharacterized protein N7458_002542 [Penicillium daleae]KAJ5460990.1 hypothetical protein N7458_002542 [Penicillium daleae]